MHTDGCFILYDFMYRESDLHAHGAQVAFMQGLPGIFKVRPQTWIEWVVAIAIGAGSLPLAFVTKLVSR